MLLYTIKNCWRKDQAWYILYPVSNPRVTDHNTWD